MKKISSYIAVLLCAGITASCCFLNTPSVVHAENAGNFAETNETGQTEPSGCATETASAVPGGETAPETTVTTLPTGETTTVKDEPTTRKDEPTTVKPEEPTTKHEEPTTAPVKDLPKGDTDEDGKVTVNDARKLLRVAVKIDKLPAVKLELWDIKKDGVIDVNDARAAIRVAVGLPIDYVRPETPVTPTQKEFAAELAGKVRNDNLSSFMKTLCNEIGTRYVGSKTEPAARQKIISKLESYGYKPKTQSFFVGNRRLYAENVVVTIPTKKSNPDIFLFCTHYDCSHLSVGAIDNGSGVSALLELARILKQTKTDYGCEIRLAFFSGEENGYYGAYKYYYSLSGNEADRHKIFFNIDMAGHPKGGKNYLCVSTEPVTETYSAVKKQAFDNIGSNAVKKAVEYTGSCGANGFYSPVAAGKHDIVPFRKAGRPSLTLSWREIDSVCGAGNDHSLTSPSIIHTKDDNLSNFDMDSLHKTTRLIVSSCAVLIYRYSN